MDLAADALEQRLRLLVEASLQLRDSSDVNGALTSVARLTVPGLADWVAIDLVDDKGRIRRAAAVVGDMVPAALWRVLEKRHFARASGDALAASIISDRSRYVKRLVDLGLGSMLVAPLRSRRRFLGTLALATAQAHRHFPALDVAVANNLAMLCALTIDNSRLDGSARAALAARDEFLQAASQELRTPLSHVKGFVSTLRRRDVIFEAAAREDFLAELEGEADRLTAVITALVDY